MLASLASLPGEKFCDIIGAKFHIFGKNIYPWLWYLATFSLGCQNCSTMPVHHSSPHENSFGKTNTMHIRGRNLQKAICKAKIFFSLFRNHRDKSIFRWPLKPLRDFIAVYLSDHEHSCMLASFTH